MSQRTGKAYLAMEWSMDIAVPIVDSDSAGPITQHHGTDATPGNRLRAISPTRFIKASEIYTTKLFEIPQKLFGTSG